MTESGQPGRATRRRGPALTGAIFEATLRELAETSFEELSFDRIAARAGTGKAALYRRWRTPAELVLAALADPETGFDETPPPATGTLRDDLVEILIGFARILDTLPGQALWPLLTQRHRHPELYTRVRELVVLPRQRLLLTLLAAAAERGEIRADAISPRLAGAGPRLVMASYLDLGTLPLAEVEAIVDEAVLPMLRP